MCVCVAPLLPPRQAHRYILGYVGTRATAALAGGCRQPPAVTDGVGRLLLFVRPTVSGCYGASHLYTHTHPHTRHTHPSLHLCIFPAVFPSLFSCLRPYFLPCCILGQRTPESSHPPELVCFLPADFSLNHHSNSSVVQFVSHETLTPGAHTNVADWISLRSVTCGVGPRARLCCMLLFAGCLVNQHLVEFPAEATTCLLTAVRSLTCGGIRCW